jgi:hypothetical protein
MQSSALHKSVFGSLASFALLFFALLCFVIAKKSVGQLTPEVFPSQRRLTESHQLTLGWWLKESIENVTSKS